MDGWATAIPCRVLRNILIEPMLSGFTSAVILPRRWTVPDTAVAGAENGTRSSNPQRTTSVTASAASPLPQCCDVAPSAAIDEQRDLGTGVEIDAAQLDKADDRPIPARTMTQQKLLDTAGSSSWTSSGGQPGGRLRRVRRAAIWVVKHTCERRYVGNAQRHELRVLRGKLDGMLVTGTECTRPAATARLRSRRCSRADRETGDGAPDYPVPLQN